jgi:hypothetical protein
MAEGDKDVTPMDQTPGAVGQARKSYARPILRRLGTVRDLTHSGGCVKMSDGGRPSKKGM